jgi:antitoxin component of RelBE/YafQ-DinJ toxin-antitoxin module
VPKASNRAAEILEEVTLEPSEAISIFTDEILEKSIDLAVSKNGIAWVLYRTAECFDQNNPHAAKRRMLLSSLASLLEEAFTKE